MRRVGEEQARKISQMQSDEDLFQLTEELKLAKHNNK